LWRFHRQQWIFQPRQVHFLRASSVGLPLFLAAFLSRDAGGLDGCLFGCHISPILMAYTNPAEQSQFPAYG
jgi:hypothetical protein